ncbi:hypothetical protein A4A49_32287 [Nicotiana attenuata]|uniref:Uncharacterized protein n=1 Tax=Nicotiana attenuata TaxID=49451 RepID=A0A1J6IL37_NICAT|nr:hypothetical protein A4A49_32287 [Nicotiana attenuata]
MEKERYQNLCLDEENTPAPSISHGYQPNAPILQSKNLGSLSEPGVRRNANLSSGQIWTNPSIGNPSLSSKEQVCKVSSHSNMAIDHLDQMHNPEIHRLAGQGVLVNQLTQYQCQIVPEVQEIDFQSSTPILHEPISSNIQKSDSAGFKLPSVRRNVNDTSDAQIEVQNVVHASHDLQEVARQKISRGPIQKTNGHPPPSLSEPQELVNGGSLTQGVQLAKQNIPPSHVISIGVTGIGVASATSPNANLPTSIVDPSSGQQAPNIDTLSIQHPQKQPNPIPNPNSNAPIKISSNFDRPNNSKKSHKPPSKNNTPPVQPGKQAPPATNPSSQKTRGSVAKVKIQIDFTKERPHHVWLGYDEDQDENGDGEWLEVQYDNVPAYCNHCKHLGHSEYTCEVRLQDEDKKKRKKTKQAAPKVTIKKLQVHPGTLVLINTPHGAEPKENQQEAEHQKDAEHQDKSNKPPKDNWKAQKRKNFKGNSQNTKRQQHVYQPKVNAGQQSQAPNKSGMPSINPPAQLERSVDSGVQNQPFPLLPNLYLFLCCYG